MGVSSFPSSPSCFRKNGRATSSTTLHLVCMCLFWNKCIRGDYFRFGSVFIKKSNQTEIFFFWKKNRNRVKPTGFGSVRFFRGKPVQTGLALFSRFWLSFFGLARLFFWFFVRFGSVRFFRFFAYKTETELAGFFKNLIGFFFRFGFFGYFFSSFLGLIGFSVFFSPLKCMQSFVPILFHFLLFFKKKKKRKNLKLSN